MPVKAGQRRISVDVDEETYKVFINSVGWGYRGKILSQMLVDFVDMMETHGAGKVVAAFMHKIVDMKDISGIELED